MDEQTTLQNRLDETAQILGNLRQVQHERLSAPPPTHLSSVPKAQDSEILLAEKITENLTEIAKTLPPMRIAPVSALRKAMGIVAEPEPMDVEPITHNPTIITTDNSMIQHNEAGQVPETLLSTPAPAAIESAVSQSLGIVAAGQIQIPMTHAQSASLLSTTEPAAVADLESELREFLESDPTLGHSPLHDDKTLEDMLSES